MGGVKDGTIVLVLGVGWRVASDALLHTLGCVLNAVAGRQGAVDVVLTGGDGVGSAACRQKNSVTLSSSHDKHPHCRVWLTTYRLWIRTGLQSPDPSWSRISMHHWGNRQNSCVQEKYSSLKVLVFSQRQ